MKRYLFVPIRNLLYLPSRKEVNFAFLMKRNIFAIRNLLSFLSRKELDADTAVFVLEGVCF